MGVLQNQRHEIFARAVAEGKTNTQAYEDAGFKPNDGNASTLAKHSQVKERVKELKGVAAESTKVTIRSLIDEADRIQHAAFNDQQYSAATSALTAKAKLAGLWVERGEQHSTVESIELTNEERNKMLNELLAKAK